jgi:hypothetical protein
VLDGDADGSADTARGVACAGLHGAVADSELDDGAEQGVGDPDVACVVDNRRQAAGLQRCG